MTLDWKPLEDLPATNSQKGGAKIGIPNGSIREMTALTDNIQSIDHDNSYAYIDFTQSYDANETFHFAFRWVQEYMYTLSDSGAVSYDYTPGWFKEAPVDAMTLTWHDPASVAGVGSDGQTGGDHVLTANNMEPGDRLNFTVEYASWPSTLYWENSRDNLPDNSRGDDSYDDSDDSDDWVFSVFVIFVLVIFFVVRAAAYDGYAGGFGTRYVFVHGLWYPAGPDGRHPRPGSVGTKHKPAPQQRLRRRKAWRRFWRRWLRRGRQPLRLRLQLCLCLCLRLRRRRPGWLQRQESVWRREAQRGAD